MKTKYRVECNFGSKYFADEKRAFIFYNYKKAQGHAVEIWLVKTETTPTLWATTQVLIDYSPKG
jgi:hypothetical protein